MNYIYRMTHIDNIPHILRYGITHKSSLNADPNYKAIGDSSIINKRAAETRITVDGVKFIPGDYIPFYFYARMPMLYNIQHGYHVEKVRPEDIVYLIVPIASIISAPERVFFFSDGHAISNMTSFYSRKYIDKIDDILDKDAIRNDRWGDDYVIKERKQAEFLVKGDIPFSAVAMICCFNDSARQKLLSMGVSCDIKIAQSAYY